MPRPDSQSSWGRHVAAILLKDLRIEWRSREILYTMGFFAVLVVMVFSFAFFAGAPVVAGGEIVAGIFWTTMLFAGTVALSRTFDRERENQAIRSLLLSPTPRSAIYVGKLAATALFIFGVELAVMLLGAVLFATPILPRLGGLLALLGLGSLGFAAVGVVFSAALLRARNRDTLLATLLFPVAIPLLFAGVRATAVLLDPTASNMREVAVWGGFVAVTDLVFLILGLWAFEPILTGD